MVSTMEGEVIATVSIILLCAAMKLLKRGFVNYKKNSPDIFHKSSSSEWSGIGCIHVPNEHCPLRQILHNNNNTQLYMYNVLPCDTNMFYNTFISLIIRKKNIFEKYNITTWSMYT